MRIATTGRKVTLKEQFEERVQKRLDKLDKFFENEAEAQVTVTVEKDRQTVEITLRDKGFMARAEKTAKTMEEAFDEAADLLTRRLVKNRKRLGAQMCKPALEAEAPAFGDETEEEEYHIIREKRFFLKPQTVEEAILEMEMLGHTFFFFRDGETDQLEVVYRRKNGDYGLLIAE
ncbi:MAG: ribosome-associated translation inhibitor RaiA [Oscillospiraceae bacterium]|nr:ribosome-associated translation inhibitor RaiA [Oscillospiraceae bacterium]